MPTNIKVIYWNVENFGDAQNGRRGNYVPLCNFIAQVVRNVDADILCLMEMRNSALPTRIRRLQRALLNAYIAGGVQTCDWYSDAVPGSLIYSIFGPPYSPNNVGFTTTQGRNEGYAVFWKPNLDKFVMQRADTIIGANATPPIAVGPVANAVNTQSRGVERRNGAAISALPGNILVPGGANQYVLPAGSNPAGAGITNAAGAVVVPPGVTMGPIQLTGGAFIPLGTIIGAAGLRLTGVVAGAANRPIVIPGNYTTVNNVTLPVAGVPIINQHVLSLVLTSKQVVAGQTANYIIGGMNNWELGQFPATDGANFWNGSRRPAFCTIKLNSAAAVAQRLIPITFYHAPLADPPRAMTRCAMGQPLYEGMDGGAPPYIHTTRAIVGGDFNARLAPASLHYQVYTRTYGNNGANFNNAGNANIRVNSPAPAMAPVFPPIVGAPTVADNPLNKSSIQLRHPVVGPNDPVLSTNFDHYRRMAIDNIFYRGFTPGEAPRFRFYATPPGGATLRFDADIYDLVRAVSEAIPLGAVAAGAAPPPDNFFIPAGIINAFAVLAIAGILPIMNAGQMLADMNAGVFETPMGGNPAAPAGPFAGPAPLPVVVTPERRASEFIKLYVSDHLPVIFQMVV